jgi:hypothetical protein
LGSDYEASSTIDLKERVLVLCSYSETLFHNWQYISLGLKTALAQRDYDTKIERIIDSGTPQLIWQSLYEQIRRTAACVADWSEYNPSLFLELGVRLAVSEWGAIQIIDERYMPGGEGVPDLKQIALLHRLFKPMRYRVGDLSYAAFTQAIEEYLQRKLVDQSDYNRIHRVLLAIINTIAEAHAPIYEYLKRQADALHHPRQERSGAPQIIFFGSKESKRDSKSAALEMRIAAWLYLHHRYGVAKLRDDPNLRTLYTELARAAMNALYDFDDPEETKFAIQIERQLKLLD